MRYLVISLCNTDNKDGDGQIIYTSLIAGVVDLRSPNNPAYYILNKSYADAFDRSFFS